MSKLTKRRALELTRDLWTFLAQDIMLGKDDFEPVAGMKHNCPCCEYAELETNERVMANECYGACVVCPLRGLWPEGCECRYDGGTPWNTWRQVHYAIVNRHPTQPTAEMVQDALAAAKRIADYATQLLEQE